MENRDFISIIIPVYNRPKLVAECLDSVLAQTNPNWECVVVDDGSTDNTWEVLEGYATKDERVRIFKRDREPKGASTCRNIGVDKSTGSFLMFLDSDDLLSPEGLNIIHASLCKYPDYDALIFPTGVFKKHIGDTELLWNKLETPIDDLARFLRQDMPWDISGPIWNMKRQKKGRWFNEEAESFQDWEMHINKLLKEISYKKINEGIESLTTFYRKTTYLSSISTSINEKNKLINRSKILKLTINSIYQKTGNKHNFEIKRLLLRQCTTLLKKGLFWQAHDLWKTIYLNNGQSYYNHLLWWSYLCLKTRNKVFEKIMEYITYSVLDRTELLNNQSTFLKTQKLK